MFIHRGGFFVRLSPAAGRKIQSYPNTSFFVKTEKALRECGALSKFYGFFFSTGRSGLRPLQIKNSADLRRGFFNLILFWLEKPAKRFESQTRFYQFFMSFVRTSMPFPHAASRTGTPFHCIDFAGMNPSKIDAGRPARPSGRWAAFFTSSSYPLSGLQCRPCTCAGLRERQQSRPSADSARRWQAEYGWWPDRNH